MSHASPNAIQDHGAQIIDLLTAIDAKLAVLVCLHQQERDARADGMCTGFIFLPMIPAMHYATDITREKSLAATAGFTLLDLSGVYDVPNSNALWVAEWDAHPNSEGHHLVADRLFAELTAHPTLLKPCVQGPE